jgi:DNA-directed RNA polymerase subunit RPC12/RpoP
MRRLVEPLPSPRCEHCRGELLFRGVEVDDPAFETDIAIYHCAACGRESSRRVIHDPYTPHASRAVSNDHESAISERSYRSDPLRTYH